MSELHTSAEDLLRAAEAGRLLVPVEVAAFIVLRCVEILAEHPRAFAPRDVTFDEHGQVTIQGLGAAGEHEATAAATELLRRLLLASSGASPSSLLEWLERSRTTSPLRLEAMRDEVEAALVPLNRDAATRLLARFIRSSAAAEQAASRRVDDRALDDELDRFLRDGRGRSSGELDALESKLVEKRQKRGPGLGITLVVIAAAAAVGYALSELAFGG